MLASGTASFFFAASMKSSAHFENFFACSSSPGTPVITSRCVCWADADDTPHTLKKNARRRNRRGRRDRRSPERLALQQVHLSALFAFSAVPSGRVKRLALRSVHLSAFFAFSAVPSGRV